ncbi:cytochrome c [Simiduia curdlanivorans]|uniref:Di-heme-cytochrome C peroxidase n=1 Tax=Simiduia curdlanivorans TaxID=1492769 RepID=A0ABV8V193_9GAMM|nr:cytochrome c [Simiduia curdlanivorans]MDN3637688.1 cytochrome c [Simiduia curdlanivorans]
MTTKTWGSRCVGVLALAVCISACDNHDTSHNNKAPSTNAAGLTLLAQNWSDQDREVAWFTSFGSRVMPYSWFLALEQAANQLPFNQVAHMESFGFSMPGASEANPDNVAIGLTKTPERDGHEWIGLGCSGCHSGQVHYRGTRLHIDGGAALIDFQGFEQAAIDALAATLDDSEKLQRFAAKLGLSNIDDLAAELASWTDSLIARQTINRTESDYGYGRLDAFGQIFNAVAVEFLGIDENRRDPNAPVSYPVLWDASHLDLVQWNASAPNAGPGPIVQNATTALAVFGHMDIEKSGNGFGFASNVEVGNLGAIQDAWYQLTAPQWPESILGTIDQTLAAQGRAIYAENCLACHALSDRNDPKRRIKASAVALDVVGTDPAMAENFAHATAKAGAFAGKKLMFIAGPVIEEESPTILLVAHAAMGALLDKPFSALWQGVLSMHSVIEAPVDPLPLYYKARPLSGIWASAPYLHNGSVMSLADLLEQPAQRASRFFVGRVEFDPINVGLSSQVLAPNQVSELNTELHGNSNAGHLFGTALASSDKRALLEYLKTL